MRCQIFRRTQWSNSTGIFNSFDSIFLIFIAYFAVVLINNCGVMSSDVCVRENGNCTCISNNTKAVQCLTKGLNSSCHSSKGKASYQLFCEVMSQFDCTTNYSVKWGCGDCLVAYTNWLIRVISQNATCLADCVSTRKPIKTLCDDVLAKCPYLASSNGYGNRPAFDCPELS